MRKIIKTAAVLSTLALTFASGCSMGKEDVVFVVNCDYGLHRQGKATLLLDGSTLFFNPDEYDIETLVIGDEITIKYSGEMLVQESYPSKVIFQGGELKSVELTEAEIIRVKYDGVGIKPTGKEELNSDVPDYVIKDLGGTFAALEEFNADTVLYATYRESKIKNGVITIEGLYSYDPR